MSTDPGGSPAEDEKLIRLAEAEREAGVPDLQTAAAAAQAKKHLSGAGLEDESEPPPT